MVNVIFLSEEIKTYEKLNIFTKSSLINLLNDKKFGYQIIKNDQKILIKNLNWGDILLIFYDENSIIDNNVENIIKIYQKDNIVIPVNISDNSTPPKLISGIKAFRLSDYKNFELASKQFLIRIQALLGLKLRNPESKIFISYRNSDGKEIAKEIEGFLKRNGFEVYMDEAKDDYDGQGKLQSGVNVQEELERNLKNASMVLLLDTTDAVDSKWIREEINWAIGNLIPLLPVIIGNTKGKKGSRFIQLKGLSRYIEYNNLDALLEEIEIFLSSIYISKKRICFESRKVLNKYKYSWKVLTKDKLIYLSEKNRKRGVNKIISHCIYYDIENLIYLNKSITIISNNYLNSNNRLLIYDGEILSEEQIKEIYKDNKYSDFIVINHQELNVAIGSNFEDW